MGKKSRRNRKTGGKNDAASATATAAASASASSGTNQCHHGSTADKFQPNGEYRKAAQAYIDMRHQANLLNNQNGSRPQQEIAIQTKYKEDHRHFMKDPEFHRFIFALCTTKYLDGCNFKADGRKRQTIQYLLLLGLSCRYMTTPEKWDKYRRDIKTDRGIIKVLVRETATHCDCMNEGKGIAKTMDQIGRCYGCMEEFPKETLLICNGCQYVRYHNRECQINHWHIHKSDCNNLRSTAKVWKEKFNRNIME
jgi:hypothetical protein